MKKDTIIGIMRITVGLALLSYVIYLGINHIDVVPGKPQGYDLTILAIVGIIALTMIYVGAMKPCFKKPRIIQASMGIFLILFPTFAGIVDNPSVHLYLADILRVIGSLALVLSFGKVCTYDACSSVEKQIETGEMEVIEIGDDKPKYNTPNKKKEEDLEVIEV